VTLVPGPPIAQMLAAFVVAAGIVALAGPWTVRTLAEWGQRQRIREDAPGRHQQKAGTPTMGGVLMVAAIIVAAGLFGGFDGMLVYGLLAMATFGAIGFADDLLAIRRGRNLGLRARERLVLQLGSGLALGALAAVQPWQAGHLVFFDAIVDIGRPAFAVIAGLLLVGFSNAVNLTDGLDGLAAGLVAIAAAGLGILANLSMATSAAVLAAAVAGAAAGFLTVNAHPARLFMGDVGSNALGAVLAAIAIAIKMEVVLFVLGGVFIAEAASVFLQVAYFKATGGRRIFKMSPLHHHFELVGWSEPSIVRRFYWAGTICLLLGLAAS
jgi:phospho-N-acetylmuramoyl-pentapeptide-transferase